MEYDHFAYGEALASALKAISHTSQKKRFFTAFGLEDLIRQFILHQWNHPYRR